MAREVVQVEHAARAAPVSALDEAPDGEERGEQARDAVHVVDGRDELREREVAAVMRPTGRYMRVSTRVTRTRETGRGGGGETHR